MKPLIFCNRSVLAWQQNAKTQTRRLVNPQPLERLAVLQLVEDIWFGGEAEGDALFELLRQPYAVGDLLWLREALVRGSNAEVLYAADQVLVDHIRTIWHWQRDKLPAMFCPRWACRYYARVVSVRAEQLRDITDEDAVAEGVLVGVKDEPITRYHGQYRDWYGEWWSDLHTKAGAPWEDNPVIWRYVLEPVDNP